MNKEIISRPIDDSYDGVEIHSYKVEFENISGINIELDTPYVGIMANGMGLTNRTDVTNLVGELFIIFRNKNSNSFIGVSIEGKFLSKGNYETEPVDLFIKTLKYLFTWVTKFVEENNVLDENGEQFIVPDFPYTRVSFLLRYPDRL